MNIYTHIQIDIIFLKPCYIDNVNFLIYYMYYTHIFILYIYCTWYIYIHYIYINYIIYTHTSIAMRVVDIPLSEMINIIFENC